MKPVVLNGFKNSSLLLALLAAFFVPLFITQAQTSCGDIVVPADHFRPGNPESRTPIIDCANPFNADDVVGFTTELSLGGQAVTEGATISIEAGQTTIPFTFSMSPESFDFPFSIYRKAGPDYILEYPKGFSRSFSGDVVLIPGEYIAVITFEDEPILNQNSTDNLLAKLTALIFPVAAAFYPSYVEVQVINFTVVENEPPAGASSVLFLPGIMGSRLYEESFDIGCTSDGGEVERWFSSRDCEQLRLLIDSEGNSIHDIYTKIGSDSVIDEAVQLNLYKSFFAQLADWKDKEKIKDYALVPYDWRLRLDELLNAKVDSVTGQIRLNPAGSIQEGYLYKTLQQLSETSFNNGKVTIVAHSNGGLLAKAFLAKLEEANDPLLEKVDNLILVASPQVGTPDTIMGMLHGTEIGPLGSIISKQTSRTLLHTMPFAFHLLPNESYFDGSGVSVDSPVIYFEPGTITTPWINNFGQSIADADTLQRFMSTDSGRVRPASDDLKTPEVVGTYLFDNYADSMNTVLNSWTPPETMQVKELAGVGAETVSGVEYFTDKECIARNPLLLFKCTAYEPKLGMRPTTTFDGDATVVTPSALAMSESNANVERWWLNLQAYNAKNFDRVHKDIFEVEDVTSLIGNTIFATTSFPYEYLTDTPAVLPNIERLVFTLHSPLEMVVSDSEGNELSSTSEAIEGGIYRRFGEVQYISVPAGVDMEVKLEGVASGSFTLEVSEYNGRELSVRNTYSAIPSSTSTKATIEVEAGEPVKELKVEVDYDGNGVPEITYDTAGEVIPVVTYTTLKKQVNQLAVRSSIKKLLLANIKVAEQYDLKSVTSNKFSKLELAALAVLKRQILLYERGRIITSQQRQELFKTIDLLSK